MDELDRQILTLLSADARLSLASLSRKVKVARSTIQARVERLEAQGIIQGYSVVLGRQAQPGLIRASVLLAIDGRAQEQILGRLRSIAEIERVIATSGRIDLLLELAAPTTEKINQVLDYIGNLAGVKNSESLIHLATRIERKT